MNGNAAAAQALVWTAKGHAYLEAAKLLVSSAHHEPAPVAREPAAMPAPAAPVPAPEPAPVVRPSGKTPRSGGDAPKPIKALGPCAGNWMLGTACPTGEGDDPVKMHPSQMRNTKKNGMVSVCKVCFKAVTDAKKREKAASGEPPVKRQRGGGGAKKVTIINSEPKPAAAAAEDADDDGDEDEELPAPAADIEEEVSE